MGTADTKPTGHMYVTSTYMLLWLPFLWGADCALGPEKFIREGSSGSRKFLAIDTKFGTLMEFNERNSMVCVIS